MSRKQLRIKNTNTENLLSHLRGEVGEIITTWVILRHLKLEASKLETSDIAKDMGNRSLSFIYLMTDKLRDELIGRISEIAENKIGRLNFYFAATKLGISHAASDQFTRFVISTRIREMRNRDVSHKELPEESPKQLRSLQISYKALLKAVAHTLRLMKKIDRYALGPSAPYLWKEARARRYEFMAPPRVGYMLVPYLKLSMRERLLIVVEELRESLDVWSEMQTMIDGQESKILACKKWGVILIGDRMVALETYPLQELKEISTREHPKLEDLSATQDLPG